MSLECQPTIMTESLLLIPEMLTETEDTDFNNAAGWRCCCVIVLNTIDLSMVEASVLFSLQDSAWLCKKHADWNCIKLLFSHRCVDCLQRSLSLLQCHLCCPDMWGYYWLFFISYVSWEPSNIMINSSCCFEKFQKFDRNSGYRCLKNALPQFWADCYILISTHHWELMKLLESHGSSLLLFMMKLMVWHFCEQGS